MKLLHKYMALCMVLLIACQPQPCPDVKPDTLIVHDTVFYAKDTVMIPIVDTTQLVKEHVRYQKLAARYDSVRQDAIIAKMQIAQAKYYIKICQRNPTQKKFLLGWMRRALDM